MFQVEGKKTYIFASTIELIAGLIPINTNSSGLLRAFAGLHNSF